MLQRLAPSRAVLHRFCPVYSWKLAQFRNPSSESSVSSLPSVTQNSLQTLRSSSTAMAGATAQQLVKTRLCIISDTHACGLHSADERFTPYRHPLPSADVLLHAGDITMSGMENEHEVMVDMLKQADAELKIVIAGNHDTSLDEAYYNAVGRERHLSRRSQVADLARIRALYCGDEAKRHGICYVEEGLRTFSLRNGAQFTIYTTPYQPAFCDWAFGYQRDQDRFNASATAQPENPVPSFPGVHIMMTHGPPRGFLDRVFRGEDVGCEHLRRAVGRAKPLIHCFGHIHEGHGAVRMNWNSEISETILQDGDAELKNRGAFVDVSGDSDNPLKFGTETLFVNAAILTVSYQPLNAPWVVDVDLPHVSEGACGSKEDQAR
ncbi:hypothetical protein LOZ12_000890 [Ophidiomyces ophidiicola]|nr:hypothetical protein LOZ62_000516 [Ophidiomyces ophidiicola]KAI2011555.1 hypothetical protein LOZ50_000575 [Ophidiomyces ophidiicola]KAI2056395.1 hypothetical protein LOZ38_000145 [Ophidiomyces ophidiicola]KAI2082067.1 hypothetical protein LOZ39_000030 [Ophidiomyces ophidiicola]KAI2083466.1 hypothetical protein LOZ37_000193 [Ophidiomyces ophidiicola]